MNLNLIKNYKEFTNGKTIHEQWQKLREEELEACLDYSRYTLLADSSIEQAEKKEALIGKILDILTAGYNLIYKLEPDYGTVDLLYKEHIARLNSYKTTKYAASSSKDKK